MSGFEVVGVVLGSIPLLISALEHYSQGVRNSSHIAKHWLTTFFQIDTMMSMARYRQTFSELHVTFVASVSIFKYDCEDLFSQRLMLSREQYRDIMDNPDKQWDATVVGKLERTLGKSTCDIFRILLEHLVEKIRKLQQRLDLNEDGRVPFMKDGIIDEKECKASFRGWKQIKALSLASRAGRFKKLVAEIEACISRIHSLITKAVAFETHRLNQWSRKEISPQYWFDIREHTLSLFRDLTMAWPETCAISHTHHAQLLVDFPITKDKTETTPEFRLSFSLHGHAENCTLPWEHRSATLLSQTPLSLSISQHANGKHSATPRSDSLVLTCKTCPSKGNIPDFCAALTWCPGSCLGVLRHGNIFYHVHDVVEFQQSKLRPLQDLIDSNEVILQRTRCSLALGLAYAVLQLYETPWLGSSWSLRDIRFDESVPHYHLWIPKSLCYPSSTAPSAHNTKNRSLLKNDTLFALGVALLELTCRRPLSSFQIADDLDEHGQEHALTRYFIANRLTEKLCNEDGRNFASAVSKCIHPASETHNFDLGNEGFRKHFFKDVILPLQDDYDVLFKKTV